MLPPGFKELWRNVRVRIRISQWRISHFWSGHGSTWQSLARGGAGVETAYLNGEIVSLGRLHGVPTPANGAITQIALRMAREAAPPGSGDPLEIERMIETLNA